MPPSENENHPSAVCRTSLEALLQLTDLLCMSSLPVLYSVTTVPVCEGACVCMRLCQHASGAKPALGCRQQAAARPCPACWPRKQGEALVSEAIDAASALAK